MRWLQFCLFDTFRMDSIIQESKLIDQFYKFSKIFSKKKKKN